MSIWPNLTRGLIAVMIALAIVTCDDDNRNTHTHSYSTTWSKNATQHWHQCSCGDKIDVANHTGDPCKVCDYSSGAHIHSYSTTWSKNATQHWHQCSCGDKIDVANHTGDPCKVCDYDGNTTSPNNGPLLLVHYMPWYDGPANSSQNGNLSVYGGHWTNWGQINPTQTVTVNGGNQARIHARQYPLTGPYHSSNPDLLDYQVSLMKMAGIDGVIFDWYGSRNVNDFGSIHNHTRAMVAALKRAELKFAICFEDRIMGMTNADRGIVREAFEWMRDNWFNDSAYVKHDGRPLVLNFGPIDLKNRSDWDWAYANVDPKPLLVHHEWIPFNDGTFGNDLYNWISVQSGTITTQEKVMNDLNAFFNKQNGKPYRVVSVYSAYDDDYDSSLGNVPYNNGVVFESMFNATITNNPNVIQIVTWNDYGEGTIIEPTRERGYRELMYIQNYVRGKNSSFPFTAEDLRWPLEFYKMRYNGEGNTAQKNAATAATNAIFSGDRNTFVNQRANTGRSIGANAATNPTANLQPLLR